MFKNCVIIIIFIFYFFSNLIAQEEVSFSQSGVFFPEVKQRVVIIGKIDNPSRLKNLPYTLSLRVHEIVTNILHTYVTHYNVADSSFLIDIPLFRPINSTLIYYEGIGMEVFLIPGDTVHVNFCISKKLEEPQLANFFQDTLYYSVDSIYLINEEQNKFQRIIQNSFFWNEANRFKFFGNIPQDISPYDKKERFKEFENKEINEILGIGTNGIWNPSFVLIQNSLIYSTIYFLNKFLILAGEEIADKCERLKFYDFLTQDLVYNEDAFITPEYIGFLNVYNKHVEQLNVTTSYALLDNKDIVVLLARNKLYAALDSIRLKKVGIWYDLSVAAFIYHYSSEHKLNIDSLEFLKQLASQEITDEFIRQFIVASCCEKERKIEEINEFPIDNIVTIYTKPEQKGTALWDEIIEANCGKVLLVFYLDELLKSSETNWPEINYFRDRYKDKGVNFIFISREISNEDVLKGIIRTNQIDGIFYLFNKDQIDGRGRGYYSGSNLLIISKSGDRVSYNKNINFDNPEFCDFIDKLIYE